MEQMDVLGYLGGMFLTVNLIPQIYKTHKSKSAKDISIFFLLLNELGLLLYTIYGFHEKLYPMALPSFLSFNLNTILLACKVRYDYVNTEKTIQNEILESV